MPDGAVEPTSSDELEALNLVVRALRPFPADVQRRIIDSALTFLGSPGLPAARSVETKQARPSGSQEMGVEARPRVRDIRQLRDEKQPRTAIEMAALVAYYLSEEADPAERKNKISDADIEKYFKQGGFKLPQHPNMTLVHAKNAGYLDAIGEGHYKINPVGYNLVTHGLPRERGGRWSTKVKAAKASTPSRPARRGGTRRKQRVKSGRA